jgi:hypothetical protein
MITDGARSTMGEKMEERPEGELAIRLAEEKGEAPEYYSNIVRAVSNIYGMTFLFGRVGPVGVTGENMVQTAQCAVHMSPAHAKSLFLILRHQLRTYEERWGRIPVSPDMEEKYGGELYG